MKSKHISGPDKFGYYQIKKGASPHLNGTSNARLITGVPILDTACVMNSKAIFFDKTIGALLQDGTVKTESHSSLYFWPNEIPVLSFCPKAYSFEPEIKQSYKLHFRFGNNEYDITWHVDEQGNGLDMPKPVSLDGSNLRVFYRERLEAVLSLSEGLPDKTRVTLFLHGDVFAAL